LSSLAELAEDIEALLPTPPGGAKVELPDCVLVDNGTPYPALCGAHRLRLAGAVLGERIVAVRAWFRSRGRPEFTWWVGPSATPADLDERLRAAGAVPFAHEPLVTSMLLSEPPPEVEGVVVRRVESLAEFAIAREIGWATAGYSEQQRQAARTGLAERWEHRRLTGDSALYLAYIDGEPVACGDVVFLPRFAFLSGAGTLPQARGRGAFRALVRTRWDEAVRRGTPTLVVGAGTMSRPILEQLGFVPVAETGVLLDAGFEE
jgi:GNAT superfamily N-acetyltransferase